MLEVVGGWRKEACKLNENYVKRVNYKLANGASCLMRLREQDSKEGEQKIPMSPSILPVRGFPFS